MTSELLSESPAEPDDKSFSSGVDRRTDIDSKAARLAKLLEETDRDGVLLLRPENVAWLTSGAIHRSLSADTEAPAVYCNGDSRWVICSNADTQRLFDEELDELGFLVKEWPWHLGRAALVRDLFSNRKIYSDQPLRSVPNVEEKLADFRRKTTDYEQACLYVLGQVVSHALEATCRACGLEETERELAGQIGHRMIHRGVQPVHIGVAVDGRSKLYRNFSYTSTPLRRFAVMTATGRKYGLTVTASRTVCFGEPDKALQEAHNAVCRVSASYLASTYPQAMPGEILVAGRRIYEICGYPHEWRLVPQGHTTGRKAVEIPFREETSDVFEPGWVVVWNVSAGAALSTDTFVVTEQGPRLLTPTESWPLKRIRIQGAEFIRPDVLQR